MDQRYYVSLAVLALVIIGAWAVSPGNLNSDSDTGLTTEQDLTPDPTTKVPLQTEVTGQVAIPIIGLSDQSQVSAQVDEAAFSTSVQSQNLNVIPDRQPSQAAEENLAAGAKLAGTGKAPFWNAGFQKIKDEPAKEDTVAERKTSDSGLVGQDGRTSGQGNLNQSSASAARSSFNMPNTLQPLSKLPNNRMVLKPIAKMGNPFENRSVSSDGPAINRQPAIDRQGDSLFRLPETGSTNSTPARLTSSTNGLEKNTASQPRLPGDINAFAKLKGGGSTRQSRSSNALRRDQYVWHVVGPSESLTSISIQYFGDSSYASKIATMNQDLISDPELLPVGDAIRVPTR